MDQWVYWISNIQSGEKLPNINWLIVVFRGSRENEGIPDPGIKSWVKPFKSLKYLLRNRCKLKRSFVFYPYHWKDGTKS